MTAGESQTSPRELPCRELVEAITDYFEGRLSEEERRRFEHHLFGCGGCRSYVEQMGETIRLTGALAEDDVPAAGHDRLLVAFRGWKDARPA
jgi:anti-sigma factor RsiW